MPDVLVDAVVTVAGHDHPVAAVGSGALGPDVAFDSFGTAQVLLRTTQGLDYPGRERLALVGINTVHHVMGDRRVLVAGTRSGLLLRRTLNLLGITDNAGREALDAAAMAESADSTRDRGVRRPQRRRHPADHRRHRHIQPGRVMARRPGPWDPGGRLTARCHGGRSRSVRRDRGRRRMDQDALGPRKPSRRRSRQSGSPTAHRLAPSAPPCSPLTPPRWPSNCPPPVIPPATRSITPAVRAMSSPRNSPVQP